MQLSLRLSVSPPLPLSSIATPPILQLSVALSHSTPSINRIHLVAPAMSLLRFSTRAVSVLRPAQTLAPAFSPAMRAFHSASAALSDSSSSDRDFRSKESSHEKEYATRQERATLMEMLARMEREADPGDVKAKKALDSIFRINNVKPNPGLVESLLKWKHTSNQ